MIVTTTNSVEGYRITDYLGIVTGEAVSGISMFRDLGASMYGSRHQRVPRSDVDLLVSFSSPVVSLFTLARALEALEQALSVPVDLVQEPMPDGSLLEIDGRVPLYEAAWPPCAREDPRGDFFPRDAA